MAIKYLISFFLLSSIAFLPAQRMKLGNGENSFSEWQSIILQQDLKNKDLGSVKLFLAPLKERNSNGDLIIYDALLANSYAEIHDKVNDKSDYYYKKAIRNAHQSNNKSLEIWSTLNYAGYLYKFRQMTNSLPVFLSIIDKIEKTDPKKILFPGQTYLRIAFYLDTIGDHAEAIKYFDKAKQNTAKRSSDYAAILDNLGMNYLRAGDLENAEKNIRASSELSRSIGDDMRYAKTLGNLAQIYELNGDYKTAIKLVLEDIQISEVNNGVQNSMYALTVLTRLYIASNQIKEAKVAVKKACAIATSKSYYKINELDLMKLRLKILNIEHREEEELGIRRRVEILEDSLNKTDGVLPLNQANWMMQKRKFQQDIEASSEKLEEESFWKNIIFGVAGFLILIALSIFFIAKNREKKKSILMQEKMTEYENARLKNENKLLDVHRTLDSQINFLKEKNIQIQKLHLEIENIKDSKFSSTENNRGKLDELLQSHLMTEENWLNFRREFQREHPSFYTILLQDFPEITDSNMRIILLQKLGFTNSETAGLLGITVDAVKKSKQRLKRKLGEKYDLLFQMMTAEN